MAQSIPTDRKSKLHEELARVREDFRQAANGLGRVSLDLRVARAHRSREVAYRAHA